MLNSSDFNNIRIGVVNEDPSYELNLQELRISYEYSSLAECLNDLTNKKNSVCFHVRQTEGVRQIDVYLDNTAKIVEYYARQFILDNVLNEQTRIFYRTTEELNSKLVVYSSSILDARKELQEAKIELDDQERTLTEYRENLSEIRSNFDEVYWPIKIWNLLLKI